ncbi:MAG: hypothetical protein IJG36_04470 [Synergistaceae bacterium]|nr:hypothetical protein [Synergistaceae bacterium]
MKYIALLAGFVRIHSPAFFMRKRERLAHRLRWVHFIDLLEAGLDALAYDEQTGRRL